MAATSGTDLLVAAFLTLTVEQQEEAFERIGDAPAPSRERRE
jgi:hypothetical protein